MLWNVDNVVRAVAVLMDDPAQTVFDKDYVIPYLNLRWDDLSTELSLLGLDYEEVIAVLPAVPAGTLNLDQYMAPQQPLDSLMFPKLVEWKQVGADNTDYKDARDVDRLDDYPAGVVGIPEYKWTGGSILLGGPSSVDTDLRVTFNAMSCTLVDPDDKTIRGVNNILAYKTAQIIYDLRGNDALAKKMGMYGDDALDIFERAAVMRDQDKQRRSPPMHPKVNVAGFFIVPSVNE